MSSLHRPLFAISPVSLAALVACTMQTLTGCGGAPAEPPKAPTAPAPIASAEPSAARPVPSTKPAAAAAPPRETDAYRVAPKTAPDLSAYRRAIASPAIPPAPALCAAYKLPRKVLGNCPSADAAKYTIASIEQASGAATAASDARLASLSACGLADGYVLALRAEFAQPQCADVVVDSALEQGGVPANLAHVLAGHSIAGKLRRVVTSPPKFEGAATKARVLAYLQGPFGAWIRATAGAIQDLSNAAAGLAGYGRGIVAVEAGMADLRFVELVRAAPLPEAFRKDEELFALYTNALEDALEPRKVRGRDAALVGLRSLRDEGDLRSDKVEGARALLSKMYAGRRIDALDSLLLPSRAEPTGISAKATTRTGLGRLPAFYISELAAISAPSAIVQALEPAALNMAPPARFPEVMRRAYGAIVPAIPGASPAAHGIALEQLELATYLYLNLGIRYWDHSSFARAADLVASATTLEVPAADRARWAFYAAMAATLLQGPPNATAMMSAPTPASLGVGNTADLDALVAAGGEYAGYAAYNAAILQQIAVPEGAGREFFTQLAASYEKAASLLPKEPAALATARATQAKQLAAAVK